jgi:hypothetical protein
MTREEQLEAVRAGDVEWVTMRPRGSSFAVLDRVVRVTGPPPLVDLAQAGDVEVLDELVALLGEPESAWAAQVLLAALTGREAKDVEVFGSDPAAWWEAAGRGAGERWSEWLEASRDELVWDADAGMFSVR